MQKSQILKTLSLILIAATFAVFGNFAHQHISYPYKHYQGSWQGDGVIYVGDKKINSRAFLLLNKNDIRLSINNKYDNFSYTFDGTLTMKSKGYVSNHFDISDRYTRGFETFVKNTRIDVPSSGNLLRLNAWRLDEGRIFIDVEQSNGLPASYILTKNSDS
ncbi:hypothetical protein [Vibrio vulnificus]|uniref:hypothetical protein n=1 Tax=Vibrio vulnificus TaxID=672 RepID=UPI00030E7696|nr:hypothetical protein [Vibrio vulnificus]RZP71025.1 hypothetical protein D8T53_00010 [Vibrio vulnificus]HAS6934518.1 hypothetical protein [Vibrio vulnificus]